ncbi:ATP phosphoribosyltransferase regulatory subunit [Tepidibacillus fermentans]|uniref:ATP phosphoribosyltransferase regulatory subunit n=1 Tax=Tepidibacillus fermentans TaxID=1281767 RepID=A0A4R3KFA3_9BACI|nr:ATP phosphoribosyltransferase regulatory subunit [Tepidibacillus fermentans]TCS81805.1 ATP phosphoribosyltransferase regulatory subunit [Tepidibacillus fermentans]
MGKLKNFEKPIGFRDLLPEMANQKREIENRLQTLFSRWGYQEMITPTLEYDQIVGKASAISDSKMFRLLDRQGNALVLRPDMTAPIARVVSSVLRNETLPIRISYHANVFRAQENEAGRFSEFYQSGIELIGERTPDADAEVLTLAIQSLRQVGIDSFRIIVGHVEYLNGILDEWIDEEEQKKVLKERLAKRDFVGYQRFVEENIGMELGRKTLLSILDLQGDFSVLAKARKITSSEKAEKALDELIQIYQLLQLYQVEEYVSFDLIFVPHLEYYTGMVFEATGEGLGFPVCSGGRYDSLLSLFNNPQYATGFALHLDRILDLATVNQESKEKVYIIYDLAHQDEALRYAVKLRETKGMVVETIRIDSKEDLQFIRSNNKTVERIYFLQEDIEE